MLPQRGTVTLELTTKQMRPNVKNPSRDLKKKIRNIIIMPAFMLSV